MLKRISVKHLRTGMFLHGFCGSWMEHPFWRSAFLLKDPKDIEHIVDFGIKEVWIDIAKGLDVPAAQTREESENKVEKSLVSVAAAPVRQIEPVSLSEEMKRAAKIITRSKQAVASMFHEARMGRALDADEALPLIEEIADSVTRHQGALISLVRIKNKDEYTYMHSVAVGALMVALARQMGLGEADTMTSGLAGLLHDVGKMMIPDKVLNKPDKLTDEEFTLIKTHPEEGHRLLLEGRNISEVVLDVCLHHHEKIEGGGYPHRLNKGQISVFAKMSAVCDVYDAITSDRPYKKGWDPGEALRKMAEWSSSHSHLDEAVFHAFVKSLGIYPIGSLVRLKSGRLGIVVEQTEKSLLTPRVGVFFSIKSNLHLPPKIVDLSIPGTHDKIESAENPEKWKFTGYDKLMGSVDLWD
ncbi:MAG: HD-GYP domain-containing protein [Georgfuchsia sp.]